MWLRLASVAFLVETGVFAQGDDTIGSLTVPTEVGGGATVEYIWKGESGHHTSAQLNNITLELIFGKAEGLISNQSAQVDTPQISYTFHPRTPGGKYHARMNGTIFNGATSLSSHASALSNTFTLTANPGSCVAGTFAPVRSLADPAYSPLRLTLPVGGQNFTQSSLSGPTGQIDVTVVRVDARFDLCSFSNVQSTLEVVNTVTGFSSGVQKQIFDFLTASYSTSNVTLDPGSWKVRANFTSNRPPNPGTFMAYSDEFFVVADGQSGCSSGSGANTNAGHRVRDFAALRTPWISTLVWVMLCTSFFGFQV
ncbi:hypothetical protein B0H19DRAFT_1256823 [Mycena capillaripes]|nr:hypothetical protein B0H19DRAFT_1256823 [Mycena capillaripes]